MSGFYDLSQADACDTIVGEVLRRLGGAFHGSNDSTKSGLFNKSKVGAVLPRMLLGRCEWGKDNYDLNIIMQDVDDWEDYEDAE